MDEDECTPAESRKREVAGAAAGVGKLTADKVNALTQSPLGKACRAIQIPVNIPGTGRKRLVNDLKKDLLKAIGCDPKKAATRRAKVSPELVDEALAELLKDECLAEADPLPVDRRARDHLRRRRRVELDRACR